jgi:hypothetical protein
MVLPVRGGATISPRWPKPSGQIRSIALLAFQENAAVGEHRREQIELRTLAVLLRRLALDRVDTRQGEIPLLLARLADRPVNGVALAQVEPPHLRRRNVQILRAGDVVEPGRAQEAVALRRQVEHAAAVGRAVLQRIAADDLADQLVLAQRLRVVDLVLLGDDLQLPRRLGLQVAQLQVRTRRQRLGRKRRLRLPAIAQDFRAAGHGGIAWHRRGTRGQILRIACGNGRGPWQIGLVHGQAIEAVGAAGAAAERTVVGRTAGSHAG